MVDVTNLAVIKRGDLMQMRSTAPIAPTMKIEKSLRSRMAAMNDTETVAVVVWFRSEPGMDAGSLQQRAYEELVRTIPEAAENFARYGKPFGSDDSEASRRIQHEYSRLIAQTTVPDAIKTAISRLSERGVIVSTINPMPALRARLTRQQIEEFAQQVAVETIYLAEGMPTPTLGDAAASQGIDRLWASGLSGVGKKIAIIEAGNVQLGNTFLNYDPYRLVSPTGDDWHSTIVAASAASTRPELPGSARGASILSVGVGTDPWDVIWGLSWATDYPHYATSVNYSWCWQANGSIDLVGRGFDYWARSRNVFVAAAAGNDAGFVCSPANAFNVLGVGGFNNKNTTQWQDDDMYASSSWQNPASSHGDREKPEMVAVGQGITAWGWDNLTQTADGTSLASPYVAGVNTLLTAANPTLGIWPEASRAILIASAIHNIEGSTRITPLVDIKDGAGALAADQALEAALHLGDDVSPCQTSCWWGQSLPDPQLYTIVNRSFTARQGERVRAAISWWSTVSPYPYDKDYLDLDFNLYVFDPYGNPVVNGTSASLDNNYEMVDFIAPMNGVYTLRANGTRLSLFNVPSNYLGIALVIPTYRAFVPTVSR